MVRLNEETSNGFWEELEEWSPQLDTIETKEPKLQP